MSKPRISARREFNQYGYNWYPQVWVETLKRWEDVEWAIYRKPEGWANPAHAIKYVVGYGDDMV